MFMNIIIAILLIVFIAVGLFCLNIHIVESESGFHE